jgi:hypothetical protein
MLTLEPSDVIFIALVIWIAIELIDGDWGGGKRAPVPAN